MLTDTIKRDRCTDFSEIRESLFNAKIKDIREHTSCLQYQRQRAVSKRWWYKEIASLNMYWGRRTGATYWMVKKASSLIASGNRVHIYTLNNLHRERITLEISKCLSTCFPDCAFSFSKDKAIDNFVPVCNESLSMLPLSVFTATNYRVHCGKQDSAINHVVFIDPSEVISKEIKNYIMDHVDTEIIVML